jgi:hypothetical protein
VNSLIILSTTVDYVSRKMIPALAELARIAGHFAGRPRLDPQVGFKQSGVSVQF